MSRVIILNNLIRFEPEKKNLSSQNAHVHISAPASYCFQLLIDKQGELVTHEELYQHAWRQFGMEATANTLYQNISVIRRGLDKCGLHEDIIRTMPRRGFILSPAVIIQHSRAKDFTDGSEEIAEDGAQGGDEISNEIIIDESDGDEFITDIAYGHKNSNNAEMIEPMNDESDLAEFSTEKDTKNKPEKTITGKGENYKAETKEGKTGRNRKCQRGGYFFYDHNQDMRLKNMLSKRFFSNAFFLLTTLSLVASILYVTLYFGFEPNLDSIRYDYAATYNNCNYYLQRDSDNDTRTLNLIYSMSESCHSHKYKYITKFSEGDMMSVISCRREMSYFSVNSCISEYIMAVGNE